MLIDGEGHTMSLTPYIGQSVIFPVLMHEEIGKLDYVIITHADADHMYGILTLMDISGKRKPDYMKLTGISPYLLNCAGERNRNFIFISEDANST